MRRSSRSFWAALLLIPTLLLETVPASASFRDVPKSNPFATAIDFVESKGVVSGYSDGTFRPSKTVNRAEFAKIIIKATSSIDPTQTSGIDPYSLIEVPYDDVKAGAWYIPYLRLTRSRHIISGYPDGSFKPNQPISLVEAAKMLTIAFGLKTTSNTGDAWYTPHLDALKTVDAIPSSIRNNGHLLTRGEVAEMVYRLLKAVPAPTPNPGPIPNPTPNPSPTPTPPPSGSIWVPAPGTTWQWQLSDSSVDTSLNVQVFDLDLFDTPKQTVDALHAKGKKVICYLSAGSYEDWRPDKNQFPAAVLGDDYEGWEGERWLDIRNINALAPILRARLDLCKSKGFDGIEPDNIDSYQNDTGFPLKASDQLTFNRWLATEAHQRGLSIGLKNDPDQAGQLVSDFDWAMTEDCASDDNWCSDMKPFIDQGKAVFQAEYTDTDVDFDEVCEEAKTTRFSPILKKRDLDAWRQGC